MLDPHIVIIVAGSAAIGALGADFTRLRRKVGHKLIELEMWRVSYNRELDRRLAAEHAASDARHRAYINAHRCDRLTSLLSQAHFRDPDTGRLSPRGVFPPVEIRQ